MLLTQKTTVKLDQDDANFIGHMCYAAFKLWNVCNYERLHYKELNLTETEAIVLIFLFRKLDDQDNIL